MEQQIVRLKGGQSHMFFPSDAREWRALLECVHSPQHHDERRFQLRSLDGSVLDVPASDVVGLEIAPTFCLARNFLTPSEMDRVNAHVRAHVDKFFDATISLPTRQGDWRADSNIRRARTLNNINPLMSMIIPKLHRVMPAAWPRIRMSPFPLNKIECQISAHGDDDFFMTHTDNALPDIAHRKVSFVYYFHREPKQFSGGLLRFYRTALQGGASSCGQVWTEIDPPHNELIIFPSGCYHEVTRVQCDSREISDQRLTINGWICI